MDISSLSGSTKSTTGTASGDNAMSSFRTADFLKVMLSELSHQDPLQPQDTSKIVENMQKLQELANTQFTKFRNDVRWAQDLMGQEVTVQQVGGLDEKAKQELASRGLAIDEGYANKFGQVSTFKVIGESVFVQVGDFDYPIDNVKQVAPKEQDPNTLARLADQLMGRQVGYWLESKDKIGKGVVTSVGWGSTGEAVLTVGGKQVPYTNVTSIGIPANANS